MTDSFGNYNKKYGLTIEEAMAQSIHEDSLCTMAMDIEKLNAWLKQQVEAGTTDTDVANKVFDVSQKLQSLMNL